MSDSFVTPWTVAHQCPLSMGFPRQECWTGLPFPSLGDLPDPGNEPTSPALAGGFSTTEPPGKPILFYRKCYWAESWMSVAILIVFKIALVNHIWRRLWEAYIESVISFVGSVLSKSISLLDGKKRGPIVNRYAKSMFADLFFWAIWIFWIQIL